MRQVFLSILKIKINPTSGVEREEQTGQIEIFF